MFVRVSSQFQRAVVRSFATAARTNTPHQRPRLPTVIKPSGNELEVLGERNLERAVRAVHQDGLVVVENVVPHDVIDSLNKKMVEDALVLQARGKDGPFNYNQGNLQQDAPPCIEQVTLDPVATQITSAVLGPKPKWTFCSANAAMPPMSGVKPQRQPVHADADFAYPAHPFALVVNVPLVTMTPENGSAEVWLGQRAETNPPSLPIIPKGSIVVRDLRLWHAGMPNKTDQVRIMLAMIHFASWYRNPMRLEFGDDIKPLLEDLQREGKLGVQAPIDWVEREDVLERYLNRGFGNSYDFNQAQ